MHYTFNRLGISLFCAALIIGAPTCLPAAVLVSNLDQRPIAIPTTIPDDAGWTAQSFVTDAASPRHVLFPQSVSRAPCSPMNRIASVLIATPH